MNHTCNEFIKEIMTVFVSNGTWNRTVSINGPSSFGIVMMFVEKLYIPALGGLCASQSEEFAMERRSVSETYAEIWSQRSVNRIPIFVFHRTVLDNLITQTLSLTVEFLKSK